MTLTYYGHCAFLWESSQGVRVLIDPFGNNEESHWFLRLFPKVDTDVLLVTHDHFDHNAEDRVPARPSVLRGTGKFSIRDVEISGVLDLHSGKSGLRGLQNTMFIIEVGGVRYCHIGDNRHDMTDEARKQIGNIDVLMVTVDDSSHLLTFEQVDILIERLSPRVVIPTHYYIKDLTTDSSMLLPPEGWLKTQNKVRMVGSSSLSTTPADLPQECEVWVMDALQP